MATVQSCAYDVTTASASFDEHNLGTYEIGFIVTTDGSMGPQSVANGALTSSPHPLPSLWSTYSYQGDTDNYSWARDYKVTRDKDSRKLYYITVTYRPVEPGEGSKESGSDPVAKEPNPVNRETVVWWDREVYTQIAIRDKGGTAILNKCQDYYQEPREIEHTRGVLVVEKNVATLAQAITLSRTYDGTVNSTVWGGVSGSFLGTTTIPARAALCREVSCSPPITEAGYVYYHLVFRFALKDLGDTWDERFLESGQFHWTKKANGTYDLIGTPPNVQRAVTDAKMIVRLAEDGTRLPYDQASIYTDWRVRREVDFNQLPF